MYAVAFAQCRDTITWQTFHPRCWLPFVHHALKTFLLKCKVVESGAISQQHVQVIGYLPSHLLSTYGQTRRKDMSQSFPYHSPFIHFFKLGFRAREHFLAPVQGSFHPCPPARPPSAISIAGHIVYDVSGADYIWQADQWQK